MRTRSRTAALAGLLVSFFVVAAASPAFAAPKKKKKAAAEEAPAAEPAEPAPAKDKSVDDLMQESGSSSSKKKASVSDSSSSSSSSSSRDDEEPVGEPDAWERPPKEEEKPKVVVGKKVEPPRGDGRRIEVALAPGFGLKTGSADWSTTLNPYFFGIAARGGYELDNHIFLGAGFVYHLGESDTLNRANTGAMSAGFVNVKQNYMLAFLEGGYDIWLDEDSWILRPSIWLGMGFAIVDPYLTSGGIHTVSDFMFAPGLNLIYAWDGWYIGPDLRYVVVTSDGVAGLDFLFSIGLRFK